MKTQIGQLEEIKNSLESEQAAQDHNRFKESLTRLGYNVSTANQLLGIGRTSVYRIAKNQVEAPEVVLRLLDMYERFGVPDEHRE
jgi:hypothetical protein